MNTANCIHRPPRGIQIQEIVFTNPRLRGPGKAYRCGRVCEIFTPVMGNVVFIYTFLLENLAKNHPTRKRETLEMRFKMSWQ